MENLLTGKNLTFIKVTGTKLIFVLEFPFRQSLSEVITSKSRYQSNFRSIRPSLTDRELVDYQLVKNMRKFTHLGTYCAYLLTLRTLTQVQYVIEARTLAL